MNILVITGWGFNDALIQTYTLPYLKIIAKNLQVNQKIYLVTFEKDYPFYDHTNFDQIKLIPFRYYPFGVQSTIQMAYVLVRLTFTILKLNISIIHCWGTPSGAIGYLLKSVTRKKLIIDSFEPHAESMIENKTWSKNSLSFKILFFFEKLLAKNADYFICASGGMVEYVSNKFGVQLKNYAVKPACVDLNEFSLDKRKNRKLLIELGLTDKIVCVYAGKFGGIYLDTQVFDFLKVAADFWGDRFRILLITAETKERIRAFCLSSNLDYSIVTTLFLNHKDVPKYMGLGDFALTPVKPVPTKRYCTPIKDGEYWALGLPIVISDNISDDSEIIRRSKLGVVLKNFTNEEYLKAVKELDSLLVNFDVKMAQRIRNLAIEFRNYSIAEKVYQKIYL